MKILVVGFIVVSLIAVGCYSTAPVQYSRVESSETSAPPVSQQAPPVEQMTRLPQSPAPAQVEVEGIRAEVVSPRSDNPRIAMVPPRASQSQQQRAPAAQPPVQQTTDDWMKKLTTAKTVLTIPSAANIDSDVRVELLIDRSSDEYVLLQAVSEHGVQHRAEIKISRIVEVKLTAPAFDVSPITPVRQVIADSAVNRWKWTLRAKKSGQHTVDITVFAVVEVEGTRVEHTLQTYAKQVVIEVSPKQRMSDLLEKYWQWLASTIVIPLLLWWRKSRKRDTSST